MRVGMAVGAVVAVLVVMSTLAGVRATAAVDQGGDLPGVVREYMTHAGSLRGMPDAVAEALDAYVAQAVKREEMTGVCGGVLNPITDPAGSIDINPVVRSHATPLPHTPHSAPQEEAARECVWNIEPFREHINSCASCVKLHLFDLLLDLDDVLLVGSHANVTEDDALYTFDAFSWADEEVVLPVPAAYVRFSGTGSFHMAWSAGSCEPPPDPTDPLDGACAAVTMLPATMAGSFATNPGRPEYLPNSDCQWRLDLDVEEDQCVRVHLEYQAMEDTYDYVDIYEGFGTAGEQIASLTGNTPPPSPLIVPGGRVTFHLTSDGSLQDTGCRFQWDVVPCQVVNGCGKHPNCDECTRNTDNNCVWCGADDNYRSGTCQPAGSECAEGRNPFDTLTTCPAYPRAELDAAIALCTVVGRHVDACAEWQEVPPARGQWCTLHASHTLAVGCAGDVGGFEWLEPHEIVYVYLSGSFDGHTLPAEVWNLRGLATARLNVDSYSSLGSLCGTPAHASLTEVDIDKMQLSELPGCFTTMPKVEHVALKRVGVSLDVGSLAGLTSLRSILLSDVKLVTRFEALELHRIPTLRDIWLESVGMQGTIDGRALLEGCPLLHTFMVQNNLLRGNVDDLLFHPNLSQLSLSDNFYLGLKLPSADQAARIANSRLNALYAESSDAHGTLDGLALFENLEDVRLSHNRISGTIPQALYAGKATLMLANNELTGPLNFGSTESTWMQSLDNLDLCGNRLSGIIDFGETYEVSYAEALRLCRNEFTGIHDRTWSLSFQEIDLTDAFADESSIMMPRAVRDFPGSRLFLGSNGIRGNCSDVESIAHLTKIDLSGNRLTGPLCHVAAMRGLEYLDLSNNAFTSVPAGMFSSEQTMIDFVDVRDNRLTSEVFPAAFSLLQATIHHGNMEVHLDRNNLGGDVSAFLRVTPARVITASHNRLTGTLQSAWFVPQVVHVDLSHNAIEGDLAVLGDNKFNSLQYVDLSDNMLHGGVPVVLSAVTLIFRDNALTEPLSERLGLMNQLETLDVSGNNITGPLPTSLGNIGTLTNIGMDGLEGLVNETARVLREQYPRAAEAHRDNVGLPRYVHFSNDFFTQEGADYSCPRLVGHVDTLAAIDLPPSYYAYASCPCLANHYGRAPDCRPCPEHAECRAIDTPVPLTTAGWFAESGGSGGGGGGDGDGEYVYRRCRLVQSGRTACRGPADRDLTDLSRLFHANECARGYQSRLCSECEGGFFKWGLRCRECNEGIKAAFPIVLVVAIVAVYGVLFKAVSSSKGTLKIVVFHLQMISFLSKMGNPIPTLLLSTSEAMSFSNLSIPGVECYASGTGLYEKFVAAFVMPFVLLGVSAVVFVSGVALRRLSTRWAARTQGTVWLHLNVRVYLFLVVTYYLSLSRWLFSVLPCDNGYMNLAPYIACGDSDHAMMTGMAAAGIVLYVIGLPAVVSAMLWRNRASLDEPSRMRVWGFLYSCYKRDLWWWELVVVLRKLAIVMVIAFSPYNSATLPILVFLTLTASAALQYRFQPFNSATDNRLELVSLATIMVTYHLALTFFIPDLTSTTGASVVVFLANLGFVCACVFVLTRRKIATHSMSRSRLVSPLLTRTTIEMQE